MLELAVLDGKLEMRVCEVDDSDDSLRLEMLDAG